ncbi:MAG: 23S rRNA (guanosine(2251)-2'-O)-methyltransferase RlmB [bacterium]
MSFPNNNKSGTPKRKAGAKAGPKPGAPSRKGQTRARTGAATPRTPIKSNVEGPAKVKGKPSMATPPRKKLLALGVTRKEYEGDRRTLAGKAPATKHAGRKAEAAKNVGKPERARELNERAERTAPARASRSQASPPARGERAPRGPKTPPLSRVDGLPRGDRPVGRPSRPAAPARPKSAAPREDRPVTTPRFTKTPSSPPAERPVRASKAPLASRLESPARLDRGSRDRTSQQERLVYGRHPVQEAFVRGDVERLFLLDSLQHERSMGPFEQLATQHNVPVQWVPEHYMASRVGDNPHQGVLALVRPYEFAALADVLTAATRKRDAGNLPGATILLLDSIEDPGNLGGILRTAAGLGIAGVVIPSRRAAGVTAAVHKTSAGTIGRIPLAQVANLRNAMETLKAAGWWTVAATAQGDLHPQQLPTDAPLVLVMGNEHSGLGPALEKACDYRVMIPLANRVESLNVGAAAAILLGAITLRQSS